MPYNPPKKNLRRVIWKILFLLILLGLGCFLAFQFKVFSNETSSLDLHSANPDRAGNDDKFGLGDTGRYIAVFTPESGTAFQYNPPTIVDEFLYIGTSTKIDPGQHSQEFLSTLPANYFYKMDLDLKPVWKYTLGGTMAGGGATLDKKGNIYFVTLDYSAPKTEAEQKLLQKGYFTEISLVSLAMDGTFRWKRKISREYESWIHGMINCAISSDDVIYVGDSKLFAFSSDGSILWEYPEDDRTITGYRSSPIIDRAGSVYFISPEPTKNGEETDRIFAYKFSPGSKGIPEWQTLLDNNLLEPEGGATYGGGMKDRWVLSSPSFSAEEKSLYAIVGNTINRVDTSSGTILWSLKPEGATGSFKASPAVDDKDNLYVGTKSNTDSVFYAIRADGKELIWKINLGADMYPSPLLGDDGRVYFGSETTNLGRFHAADRLTGQLAWNLGKMGDLSFGSPLLYKGFLYIGIFQVHNGSDALFKVKADAYGYMPGAAWPRFHGGNANTGRGPS